MHHCKLSLIAITSLLSACMFDLDGDDNSDSSPAAGEVLINLTGYKYQPGDISILKYSTDVYFQGEFQSNDSYTLESRYSHVNEIPAEYGYQPTLLPPYLKIEEYKNDESAPQKVTFATLEASPQAFLVHYIDDGYFYHQDTRSYHRESNNDDPDTIKEAEKTIITEEVRLLNIDNANEVGSANTITQVSVKGVELFEYDDQQLNTVTADMNFKYTKDIYGYSAKSFQSETMYKSWIDQNTGTTLKVSGEGTMVIDRYPDRVYTLVASIDTLKDPRLEQKVSTLHSKQNTSVLPHTKLQLNHHAERIQHSLRTMGF